MERRETPTKGVHIYYQHATTVRIPHPDGSVTFKPGKPIIALRDISVTEFAEAIGLGARRVQQLCDEGRIKARQIVPRGKYRIPITELELALQLLAG